MPDPFIKIPESRNGCISTISEMKHFDVGVIEMEVIVSPMFCLNEIDIVKRYYCVITHKLVTVKSVAKTHLFAQAPNCPFHSMTVLISFSIYFCNQICN